MQRRASLKWSNFYLPWLPNDGAGPILVVPIACCYSSHEGMGRVISALLPLFLTGSDCRFTLL